MTRKTGIAALMLLSALPLASLAATVPQPKPAAMATGKNAPSSQKQAEPSTFKQLDANHDGYISKAEATRSAKVGAKFDTLDANHDGRISAQEYVNGGMS